MIDILLPAAILMLIVTITHSYFGFYIIKRGIIFTDLAVGQMAAVGAALSIAMGDPHYSYLLTLSFAIMTAITISIAGRFTTRLEPFIALIYSLSFGLMMIVLTFIPSGAEELTHIMAADLLFTTWDQLLSIAIVSFLIALTLFFIRHIRKTFWGEMIFFALFAMMIATSVQAAGVFIVFTFLIAPAYSAILIKGQSLFSLATFLGLLGSFIGLYLSYRYDIPTGAMIISIMSLMAIMAFVYHVMRFENKG